MDVVINYNLYTCEIVALLSARLQKIIENVDVLIETTIRRRICACFTVVSRKHVLLKQTCANSTTVEPH